MSRSLYEAIQATPGGVVPYLRNLQSRAYTFPVQPEFSNWRSESAAWRQTAVLFDQSHHMTDLFISGPDAIAALGHVGVNSVATFGKNKARQFVAVNHEGYVIADAILVGLDDTTFDLVGHPAALDWFTFHTQRKGFNVRLDRDENSIVRRGAPPQLFRYEIQGPNALKIMDDLCAGGAPQLRFFNMTKVRIGDEEVNALRHGMAGEPGFELSGPWEAHERIHHAILAAGARHGLVQAGSRAYSAANLESAWVPTPFTAWYTGRDTQAFLQWMRAGRVGSLGGSFNSDRVEDYYVTPYDLGYGHVVAFDHDFIGRSALEKLAKQPHRQKVTLVWNAEDMVKILGSQWQPGDDLPAKSFELPKARYAFHQYDRVEQGGRVVGVSMDVGYSVNERQTLSLALVDEAVATPGTELVLHWGESPNSTKPRVEAHRQVPVRVTVAPAPYGRFARENYRKN